MFWLTTRGGIAVLPESKQTRSKEELKVILGAKEDRHDMAVEMKEEFRRHLVLSDSWKGETL